MQCCVVQALTLKYAMVAAMMLIASSYMAGCVFKVVGWISSKHELTMQAAR
jgi:hypothetical protein